MPNPVTYPIKVVEIELSQPIQALTGLQGYQGARGLVRLHGIPIAEVNIPLYAGCCDAQRLSQLILEQHRWAIMQQLLINGLTAPDALATGIPALLQVPPPPTQHSLPTVTVAVCTRDRPTDLEGCLAALCQLRYPHLELLVIDNAPSTDATEQLVSTGYPQVRYVREPRPGLDWARNRAALEAQGEIIAYTDDDVRVDPGWVEAIATVFAEQPEVMAVTGLVLPEELETEAQVLFEVNGGFGRGFERKWYRVPPGQKMPWHLLSQPGMFGTGANMAYRRRIFEQIGYFDPALDVGTVTNGAGDLDMFFRVLKHHYTLVYEPRALVRHQHRRDYAKLRRQIRDNGSVYSYLVANGLRYPEERWTLIKLGLWWVRMWHIRKLFHALVGIISVPVDLVLAEIWGCWIGVGRYFQAQRIAQQITQTFGELTPPIQPVRRSAPALKDPDRIAVRQVELTQPLAPISDILDYRQVRLFITWHGAVIGQVDLENQQQPISVLQLREQIVQALGDRLLDPLQKLTEEQRWAKLTRDTHRLLSPAADPATLLTTQLQVQRYPLPTEMPVAVVVPTYDRPTDLRQCLTYLLAQKTSRPLEIIVVDNHPSSGLTPPIVAEFPSIRLIREPRQGVAYARNSGILASHSEIIVTTDDDVVLPPDWLEKLIAPFARPEVMIVTGNTLPIELETDSQWLFEHYGEGGLGRGFQRFEANRDWFTTHWPHAIPAWLLGGTANAAFRASIFQHPQIGLMYEPLGPGMPAGVGDDTYIFYQAIKAGYSVVYEPTAFVWHRHRQSMAALRRQLYSYSKGIVSYQLTTLLRERDPRALMLLLIDLPKWHLGRIRQRLRGQTDYSLPLIALEILGHLAGPWSLWRSHQRVQQTRQSPPTLPPPTPTLSPK